jgi:hypothetical protein
MALNKKIAMSAAAAQVIAEANRIKGKKDAKHKNRKNNKRK